METMPPPQVLNPEAGKLVYCKDSMSYKSVVYDAELDPIECNFQCDDTLMIRTEDYEYISLDREALVQLITLLDLASEKFENEDDIEFDEEE